MKVAKALCKHCVEILDLARTVSTLAATWESDEHQATDLARRPHPVERLNMIAPDDGFLNLELTWPTRCNVLLPFVRLRRRRVIRRPGVAEGKIGGAFAYAVLVTLRANLPRWLQRVSHS